MLKYITLLLLVLSLIGCESLKVESFSPYPAPELHKKGLDENRLAKSKLLDLGGHFGPEDVLVSLDGKTIYAGVHDGSFRNGKLIEITEDKAIKVIYESSHWISGLEFSEEGDILALVFNKGLVSINLKTKEVSELVSNVNNKIIRIPNDVAVGKNGNVYFSVTSFVDKFSMKNAMKIVLEQRNKGGVYKFNTKTKELTEIINGGVFLNGVEVSNDESYLLYVETGKYRVYKHWLKGEKSGETEILIDNLEGLPNGISKSSDGNYWVGFSSIRSSDLDFLHNNSALKQIVHNLPSFMKPALAPFGIVLKISPDGKILKSLYDKTGLVVKEATSVSERNGRLYFGGDKSMYIPYIKL